MDNKITGKIVASDVIVGSRYIGQKRIDNTVLGSKRIGKISEVEKTLVKQKILLKIFVNAFIVH